MTATATVAKYLQEKNKEDSVFVPTANRDRTKEMWSKVENAPKVSWPSNTHHTAHRDTTHLLVNPRGDVDRATVVIVLLLRLRARRRRPRPVR